MTTRKRNDHLVIGAVLDIPFVLSAGAMVFPCVITDTRSVFGRTEWEITPVHGTGSAFVTEKRLLNEQGPVIGTPSWSENHNKKTKKGGE